MFFVFAMNAVLLVHITPLHGYGGRAWPRTGCLYDITLAGTRQRTHIYCFCRTHTHTHTHTIARRNTPVFFGIDYTACDQTIRVEARFCENCAVLVWCAYDCN